MNINLGSDISGKDSRNDFLKIPLTVVSRNSNIDSDKELIWIKKKHFTQKTPNIDYWKGVLILIFTSYV